MTEAERIVADYAGTGLTVGRHPMALRREELAMRGVLRASDLRVARQGRRVRVAGMVITRQRPGTAKGFVFLTLEDETGVANIIVRPDLFARDRLTIIEEPFLIVDGVLQNQDGVTSVRAEQVLGMRGIATSTSTRTISTRVRVRLLRNCSVDELAGRQIDETIAQMFGALAEASDDLCAMLRVVGGGARVGVAEFALEGAVDEDGEFASGGGHRLGFADAIGEPAVEGAERRLRAAEIHRG